MPKHAIMPRFLAPAGAPVPWSRVLQAVRHAGVGEDALRAFPARFHVKHVWGMSSGRAALATVLQAMGRLRPGRDVVVIPAYTCFSVPAAIVRSGLKVLPVEIDPRMLDFDLAQLEAARSERWLAVVNSNLFGYPHDAARAASIAHDAGAFFIDDAAQALGATRESRFAGTRGDVGLYSLGRGKALPVAHGGILVSDSDEIADAMKTALEAVPRAGGLRSARLLLEVLATSCLLSPWLYWIPNSMPFLRLGITEFDPGFAIGDLPAASRELVSLLLGELEEINRRRVRNATAIVESLGRNAAFRGIDAAAGSQPIYLRLPLLACDGRTRDGAQQRLWAAGIGATGAYPAAICDIEALQPSLAPGWAHCPRAESVASRMLTLPTHAFVEPRDIRTMSELLAGVEAPLLKNRAVS